MYTKKLTRKKRLIKYPINCLSRIEQIKISDCEMYIIIIFFFFFCESMNLRTLEFIPMLFSKREPTWTKFAALLRHADLLARWTRQWWAYHIRLEPLAGEATIVAVAFDALFRRDPLAVIVYCAMQ